MRGAGSGAAGRATGAVGAVAGRARMGVAKAPNKARIVRGPIAGNESLAFMPLSNHSPRPGEADELESGRTGPPGTYADQKQSGRWMRAVAGQAGTLRHFWGRRSKGQIFRTKPRRALRSGFGQPPGGCQPSRGGARERKSSGLRSSSRPSQDANANRVEIPSLKMTCDVGGAARPGVALKMQRSQQDEARFDERPSWLPSPAPWQILVCAKAGDVPPMAAAPEESACASDTNATKTIAKT